MPTGFQWRALALTCAIALLAPPVSSAEPSHGFSYFGDLKYPPDMGHFDYVNSNAPKGGRLKLAVIGTFNNLNPISWKSNYRDVVRLERIDDWSFTFHFSDTAEKTLQLTIQTAKFAPLPKHYWKVGQSTKRPSNPRWATVHTASVHWLPATRWYSSESTTTGPRISTSPSAISTLIVLRSPSSSTRA